MRVLITGAGGFIGRHLQTSLRENGKGRFESLPLQGRSQGLDLSDRRCLEQLPACEAIVHLAGVTGLKAFDADPVGSWTSNLLSTLHILEHARRTQARRLVLTSSYVYGPPQYLPVDEAHPIAPHHAYQRSKYLSEQLAEQFARDGGAPVTVLRLFNVYGPGQSQGLLIPDLLAQVNQPRIRLGDPRPRRDYIHVNDVAAAIGAALTAEQASAVSLYNIGSGTSVSVAELVEIARAKLAARGITPEIEWSMTRRGAEVDEVRADIRKAGHELGWQPRISLEAGLEKLLCAS